MTPDIVAKFISYRFMPNQTNQEVYRFFMKMMEDTNETYGIHFMDFLHKHYKQRSKSVENIHTSRICLSSSFEAIERTEVPTISVAHPVGKNDLARQASEQLVDRMNRVVPVITNSTTWNTLSRWTSVVSNHVGDMIKKIQ
jgi:hypothetical protein